jgi:hypothetical protein
MQIHPFSRRMRSFLLFNSVLFFCIKSSGWQWINVLEGQGIYRLRVSLWTRVGMWSTHILQTRHLLFFVISNYPSRSFDLRVPVLWNRTRSTNWSVNISKRRNKNKSITGAITTTATSVLIHMSRMYLLLVQNYNKTKYKQYVIIFHFWKEILSRSTMHTNNVLTNARQLCNFRLTQ